MVIQHNMAAMNTNRQLGISVNAGSKSTEKLSSGYRINRAGDDAAGLAISEKMRSQIRGLDRASANSQDGISLIQTAEGALNETQSILQRMRELAVQAANGTNTDSDRAEIQKEVNQLTSEINRIANTTEFNTMKLLKGNTNKAEIGGVDSETLKAGETGVAQGVLENFNVDTNSTKAVDSKATLIGNTADATGSLKSDTLEENVKGEKGTYSTAMVGGIMFSSKEKSSTLNDTNIKIVSIADEEWDATAGGGAGAFVDNAEGIIKDKTSNTIYIALKQSTIDKDVTSAQDLINKIKDLKAGTTNQTAGAFDVGTTAKAIGLTGATADFEAKTLDDFDLEMTLPENEATKNNVKPYLPSAIKQELAAAKGTLKNGSTEKLGEYKLQIQDIFKEENDTVTIGGQKFTAKMGNASAAAGEFDVSPAPSAGTITIDFSTNLTNAFAGTLTANSEPKFSIDLGGGSFDVKATANMTGQAFAQAVVDEINNNHSADATAKLEDGLVTITTTATGATVTPTITYTAATGAEAGTIVEANINNPVVVNGSDNDTPAALLESQTKNLVAAINANKNLNTKYTATAAADGTITLKEKADNGGVGESLDRDLIVKGSGGVDDTITITNLTGKNGIEFELVQVDNSKGELIEATDLDGTGGATTKTAADLANEVVVTQDANNKNKFKIYLGESANLNKASKIQEALRNFTKLNDATLNDGTKISFKDIEVESSGNWDTTTTNLSNLKRDWKTTDGGVEEKKGTYSFDLTTALADGDEIVVAGRKFIAKTKDADINKGEIDISSTNLASQAVSIMNTIAYDEELGSKYNVTTNNSKIILTEKEASGVDLEEKDVKVQATGIQGQYKINDLEMLKDGASITIDGQKIDVSSKNTHVGYADGTAIKVTETEQEQKAALAAAINKNAELSKKYEASISEEDGSLMLTQKVGSEEGPEITTTSSTKGTFDVTFQVGANTGQSMTIAIGDNRANALGVSGDGTEESIMADNGATAYYTKTQNVTDGTTNDNIEYALDVTSFEKATAAIGVIDDALSSISAQRSQLGAYQNRLEHTIANLDNTSENLQSAESRIRDVDMAKEMTNFSKNNILQQAAQSMLAQANQSTQGVLTLLR